MTEPRDVDRREPSFTYIFWIVWKVFWSIALIAVLAGFAVYALTLMLGH